MIYDFKAVFENVKTSERISYHFSSCKSFIEAWEDAVSYFNKRLIEKDKYWRYKKIEQE